MIAIAAMAAIWVGIGLTFYWFRQQTEHRGRVLRLLPSGRKRG